MTNHPTNIGNQHNAMTVASYEQCAAGYAASTAPDPARSDRPLLQRLVEQLSPQASVLEIGSGPGWDADWLEMAGLVVRRTDVTDAFLTLQRDRGKPAHRLNVLADPIAEDYDAIIALYVLQHSPRPALSAVLAKLAAALRPGGTLLLTILAGEGEEIESGDEGRRYYICRWQEEALVALLAATGLSVTWSNHLEDDEGRWLALMVRRGG